MKSGRPDLINELVAPLLWGCFTRVIWRGEGGGGGLKTCVCVHSPAVPSLDTARETGIPLGPGGGWGMNNLNSKQLSFGPREREREREGWGGGWGMDNLNSKQLSFGPREGRGVAVGEWII